MVTKDSNKNKESKSPKKTSSSALKVVSKKTKKTKAKKETTKKSAVKKSATKKTSAKNVSKKTSDKTKQTTVKKKRVAKSAKTSKTTKTKRSATTKSSTRKNKKTSDEVVILPSSVSQRSLEKSILLRENWEAGIQLFMYYLSYVSAFVFMIIGSSILLTDTFGSSSFTGKNMVANVNRVTDAKQQDTKQIYQQADSIENMEVMETDDSYVKLAQNGNPVVHLDDIPLRLKKKDSISFFVTNLKSTDVVRAYISNTRTPLVSELSVKKVSDGKFSAKILSYAYPAGYYRLNVMVLRNGKALVSKHSTEFKNGSDEEIKDALSKIKVNPKAPRGLNVDNSAFYFKTPAGKVLSGVARIELKASKYLPYVELYARSVTTGKKVFLAKGGRMGDYWFFSFDSRRLPNGKYGLIAKSKFGDKHLQTGELLVTVSNTAISKNTHSNNFKDVKHAPTFEKTIKSALAKGDYNVISTAAEKEAVKLLKEKEDEVKDLTVKYAATIINEDDEMKKRIGSDLESLRKDLVLIAKNNENTKDIAGDISAQLEKRIAEVKNRVLAFEKVNRGRTDNLKDTDGDGISDYDEINIYNTDPTKSDSDSDGVDDGSELLQQTSPTKNKAKIKFESPKETVALTRDDILHVAQISFVEQTEVTTSNQTTEEKSNKKDDNNAGMSTADKKVLSIKGKGLPNSFLTLFIYSLPTVVSVKTDDEGNFTYFFDKELENGKHDVYVAVTNGDGKILAQSKSFSFIKKAEAVSFVDDVSTAKENITESTPIETSKSYRSIIGISVLSFGLILLMMGISLRPKKDTVVENIIAD